MKNINKYNQITQEERAVIAHLWRQGKSKNYIAKDLKRSWDTLDKEIERKGFWENEWAKKAYPKFGKIEHYAVKAQKKYLKRRKESKEKYKIIENNYLIEEKIIKLITKEQLSPEEISGRYRTISHQTIYNWIYRIKDIKLKKKIVSNLRRKGKKYRKTSKLYSFQSITAPKKMIDERAKVINERKRLGDFEGKKTNCFVFFLVLNEVKEFFIFRTNVRNRKIGGSVRVQLF